MYRYAAALALAIAFYYSNLLGLDGLYVSVGPYDIFMHLFGGVVIGVFVYALVQHMPIPLRRERRIILVSVFVAGVLWEIFEAYYGIAGYPVGTKLYYIDTLKDLIDDVVGGFFIAWVFVK